MKVKYLASIIAIILGSMGIAGGAMAEDLSWQDEVDVQFTFESALSMVLSRQDLTISELAPGSADNSNEITITVGTNNVAGYQLKATVGDAMHDSHDLSHASVNGAKFASLDVGSSAGSLTTPNTWGYSTNSGTTYSGLPKYDDAVNVATLATSSGSGTGTTKFLIGAYAAATQVAGDFTNVINFTAVTNINAEHVYLQDLKAASAAATYCTTTGPTTVYDERDGAAYKIMKLADGNCWMLDNLRLGSNATKTLTPNDTNIASNFVLPASSTTGFTDASASYTSPAINIASKDNTTTSYGSGSGKIGVYYNYCAASAGTYCEDDGEGTGNASYDICPAGWRLPTGGSAGEYQALYTAYNSVANDFRAALSTPLSGYFENGSASSQGSDGDGYFWSSTYNDGSSMYGLKVGASSVTPQNTSDRYVGASVRCVLK